MPFTIDFGKLLILLILFVDLIYFFDKDFIKRKKTVLFVLFIFLMLAGSLFNLLKDYIDIYSIKLMQHLFGVALLGMTAMFISIHANKRMNKVIMDANRPANTNN